MSQNVETYDVILQGQCFGLFEQPTPPNKGLTHFGVCCELPWGNTGVTNLETSTGHLGLRPTLRFEIYTVNCIAWR